MPYSQVLDGKPVTCLYHVSNLVAWNFLVVLCQVVGPVLHWVAGNS